MRESLIQDLLSFPASADELPMIPRFDWLLKTQETCFFRHCFEPGHITGSALLVSPDGAKVLLNHHKIFDRWMHFGGHADGDEDVRAVALREVFEESGIEGVSFLERTIFDIDIHEIPENPKKGEPLHFHFDIVFLLQASHENFVVSNESNALKWCDFDEAVSLCRKETSGRMIRMLEKWKARRG